MAFDRSSGPSSRRPALHRAGGAAARTPEDRTSKRTAMATDALPAIEIRGLTKRFLSTLALDGVDLTIMPGEIHALVGENGAGKSTLIKILAGLYQPDAGEILRERASGPSPFGIRADLVRASGSRPG